MREKLKKRKLKRILKEIKMGQRGQNDETLLQGRIVADFSNTGIITPNASGNVTISNVAPAAVGTATISKWLRVFDGLNGTAYFIPMWT